MNKEELRQRLLDAPTRAVREGREAIECREMNYGERMYNMWLAAYEYLESTLGIEPSPMKPQSEQLLKHYAELGDLPFVRVIHLDSYRSTHQRVACRFEGKYKWNLYIDWISKVGIRIYYPMFEEHRDALGLYVLSAEYREPELPDLNDEPNLTKAEIVSRMETYRIGSNMNIWGNVEGWITLVEHIERIETG